MAVQPADLEATHASRFADLLNELRTIEAEEEGRRVLRATETVVTIPST